MSAFTRTLDHVGGTHDSTITGNADCALPCPHLVVSDVARPDELVGGLVLIRAVLLRGVFEERLLADYSLRDRAGQHLLFRTVAFFHFAEERTVWQHCPMLRHLPQPRH